MSEMQDPDLPERSQVPGLDRWGAELVAAEPCRGPRRRLGALKLRRPRVVLVAIALGSLLIISPVRAAIGDAVGGLSETFSGYFEDQSSESAPGEVATPSDNPPRWLNADGRTGQRVLASAEGFDLFIVREPSGAFGFALDDSVGLSASAASWQRKFRKHDVVVLGPILDPREDTAPLFGVTSADVESVRIDYNAGPSITANAQTGGFVAIMDITRKPVSLAALSSDGAELELIDLTYLSIE